LGAAQTWRRCLERLENEGRVAKDNGIVTGSSKHTTREIEAILPVLLLIFAPTIQIEVLAAKGRQC
jgi:hypothetical protein